MNDVLEAVEDRLQARAVRVVGRWETRQQPDREHRRAERHGVDSVGRRKTDGRDQDSGHRRARDAGELEHDVLDGDRGQQLLFPYELRCQRVSRRALKPVGGRAQGLARVQRPDLRVGQQGVDEEADGHEEECDVGDEEHPPAVDGVGDRAAVDRDDQQRDERRDPEQADEQRRPRLVVELERNGDRGDLASDRRDARAEPQPPERPRAAQGTDVDRDPCEQAAFGRFGSTDVGQLEELFVVVRA